MLNNKKKYFLCTHLFFSSSLKERRVYFLNKNVLSYYLLNLTFYNDRLFNFSSKKINLDKFGVIL